MADTFRALCAELTAWAEKTSAHYFQPPDVLLRARAALADEPAAPAPPADGEVAELVAWIRGMYWAHPDKERATRAADLLQRLNPPQPVPVSERLPGPEDCVPHPRTKRGNWCWGFERCEVSLARPARWRLMHMETVEMEASHWLFAHALPLPLPEVGE